MNQTKKIKHSRLVFRPEDYTSGEGMMTKIWGPAKWHTLHVESFNYPIHPTLADKKHYRDAILLLQYTLPCKYCRQNLRKNLRAMPLTMHQMESRDSFSRYIYALHEKVNTMLGKKSHLTYEQVRDRYEHFRSRCSTSESRSLAGSGTKKTPPPILIKPKNNKKKTKKHTGCITPLHGKKSKCVLRIVPLDHPSSSFSMSSKI
jgi:hypothetical protein